MKADDKVNSNIEKKWPKMALIGQNAHQTKVDQNIRTHELTSCMKNSKIWQFFFVFIFYFEYEIQAEIR